MLLNLIALHHGDERKLKALYNISSVKFFFIVLLLQFYEIWKNRSIRSIMVNCSLL